MPLIEGISFASCVCYGTKFGTGVVNCPPMRAQYLEVCGPMRGLHCDLDRLSEGGVEDVDSRHGGVAQPGQRAGQTADVVALVLQTGAVEGELTDQTVRLLLPPGGDHHAAPLGVLVQHHLLHLLLVRGRPGGAECPDEAGVVERSLPHLTPQSDLSSLEVTTVKHSH